MKTLLLIGTVITSMQANALTCFKDGKAFKLSSNDNEATLIIEDLNLILSGKKYSIDYSTNHYLFEDEDQNSYSVITELSHFPSHCRARVCPPVQSQSMKISKNFKDYDYLNCL